MATRKLPFGEYPTSKQIKAVLNFVLASNKDALLAIAHHESGPVPATRARDHQV